MGLKKKKTNTHTHTKRGGQKINCKHNQPTNKQQQQKTTTTTTKKKKKTKKKTSTGTASNLTGGNFCEDGAERIQAFPSMHVPP